MRSDLELRRARAAANEVLFRQVNDRIDELNVGLGGSDAVPHYVCECLNVGCAELIAIPHEEYQQIRRNPIEFFVVPGHEQPDVEEAVHWDDRCVVVRKLGAGAEIAAEAAESRQQ